MKEQLQPSVIDGMGTTKLGQDTVQRVSKPRVEMLHRMSRLKEDSSVSQNRVTKESGEGGNVRKLKRRANIGN